MHLRYETMHKMFDRFLIRIATLLPFLSFRSIEGSPIPTRLRQKVILDSFQYLLLTLFQGFGEMIWNVVQDFLDLVIEFVHADEDYFIVDPICLALMKGFDDLIEFFIFTLIIILQKIHQISFLEVSRNPVLLGSVPQESIALENAVFELSDVVIFIFEPLLAEAIQLRVVHIASLGDFQLEFVLVSMGFRVVASVTASEDNGKGKSIDKSSFFEAQNQFIPVFIALYIISFLKVIFHHFSMSTSYQKLNISNIEYLIEKGKVLLFMSLVDGSFLKEGVGDGLIDIAQKLAFTLQLIIVIIKKMGKESISSIHSLGYPTLCIFCRQQAMMSKEHVMTMHHIIQIISENRSTAIMEQDSFSIFFERFNAAHIHGIFVMTKIICTVVGERDGVVVGGWNISGVVFVDAVGPFWFFVGTSFLHFLIIKQLTNRIWSELMYI